MEGIGLVINQGVFQSSPDPKAGCYIRVADGRSDIGVSILTRPEGRVLPVRQPRASREIWFQSSPDPKAGCYTPSIHTMDDYLLFQSSPDPKAGCYVRALQESQDAIWFQSSPDPQAGCYLQVCL